MAHKGRYQIFSWLNRHLPADWKATARRISLLHFIKETFLRPSGYPACTSGLINYEGLQLHFTAPYQVFQRAQIRGIENRISRSILANVPQGGICIDVGANYGFLTLMMASAVGADGKVYSFEAVPFIYDVLKQNVKSNQFENVCDIELNAVSNHSTGTMDVQFLHHQHKTNVTSIDDYFAGRPMPRLDLLKIDVDGGDWEVLQGAIKTISRHKPILIIEMTAQQAEIYETIRSLGYTHLQDMEGQPIVVGRWPENLFAAMHPIEIPARGEVFSQ